MNGAETAILLIVLSAAALIAALAFLFEISLFALPPFVPAPRASLAAIVASLGLEDGQTLIDLGCGDGRVLEAALAARPGLRAVGVDRHLFPLLLARLRLGRRAELRREDFFRTPLGAADRVYLYCWPAVLAKLRPKLEGELKPGARVVSADFRIEGLEPSRVIEAPGDRRRVKTLYIYDF